jgi:integrase
MKYCQIININNDRGTTTPILLVKDKISILTLTYIRDLELRGKSQSTIQKILQSIAYMWDFYLTFEDTFKNRNDILKKYSELRLNGSVDSNDLDKNLLFWKPVKLNTVKLDINNLTEYSLFLEQNFNGISLNPLEEKFKEDIEYVIKKGIQQKYSFLNHITNRRKSVKIKSFDRKDSYGKHSFSNFKAFPYNKVNDLIKISSLRDKLIFILLSYGGCRSSEIFHLFLNDISFNQKNQTAFVSLVNPVEGYIEWSKNGKEKKGTRKEYLLNKYNLIPRNIKKDKYYAGWKSMTEDDGKRHISNIYWSNPDMGKLFYQLHLQYMELRLKMNVNHPYYFVSLSKNEYGQPLTMNALKNKFNQIIKKIELSNSIDGCNLHGLRHFYGYYCANKLKVSKEVTQRMMHHRSIKSTEIYYQKSMQTLEEELNKGYLSLKEANE